MSPSIQLSTQRTVCFVTSDLHIGDGGNLDDFEDDALFASWLASMDAPQTRIVLNGDVVDFAQIPPYDVDEGTPSHLLWREPRSLDKLAVAIDSHPVFFDALADFHRRGGTSTVVVGNHDLDFAWPGVQTMWRDRVAAPGPDVATFETYATSFGKVWIQHGHQHTKENLTRDLHDFIHVGPDGEEYLERVWGTDFVINFFNDVHDELPFAQNIKPTWQLVVQGLKHRWLGWRHFVRTVAFIARAGIPLGLLPEVLLDGEEQPVDLARLDDHFADVATAQIVRDAIAEIDPVELATTELDPSLRAALASGVRLDLVAEQLEQEGDGDVTLGLFRDDRIVRGARSHLSEEFDHVVFGHTHHVVDGQELAPGKRLFNPGTWIPFFHLDDPAVESQWRASGFAKRFLTDSSFYRRDIRAVEIRADRSEPSLIRLSSGTE